jgi:hypothetical protein
MQVASVSCPHLEREVPCMLSILGGRGGEDVEIACAEDEGIERLCDERYAYYASCQ